MSDNQKHTVSTDALDTLGTCPIPEGSGRDAIHLAVEPVICGETALAPGQRAKIVNGVAVRSVSLGYEDATGIVDPFLTEHVRKGEQFWFIVLPRTITSLRHVWSHPAFAEPYGNQLPQKVTETVTPFIPAQSMAMARMKEFCHEIGERYDYIMAGAKAHLEHGEYTYGEKDSGNLEGVSLYETFWDDYEVITGKVVPGNDRESFFTCSC